MVKNKFIKYGLISLAVLSFQLGAQTTKSDQPITPKSQQEIDAVNQSQANFEVVKHSDGSESVDLKGRFQMYSVAKVVNGEVVYSCQNHDQLGPNHSHAQTKSPAAKRGEQ